jgi:hypothetical protein
LTPRLRDAHQIRNALPSNGLEEYRIHCSIGCIRGVAVARRTRLVDSAHYSLNEAGICTPSHVHHLTMECQKGHACTKLLTPWKDPGYHWKDATIHWKDATIHWKVTKDHWKDANSCSLSWQTPAKSKHERFSTLLTFHYAHVTPCHGVSYQALHLRRKLEEVS